MTRILIIVSYVGPRHWSQFHASDMLRIQAEQLRSLHHSLDKILIVVPRWEHYSQEYEDALALFSDVMRVPNGPQASYGAWRDAYLANPGYEWYFFLEDDYMFYQDDFDQKMIDMWKPGMGYLAEWQEEGVHHAAAPHGLARGDVLKTIDWNRLTATDEYNNMLQIGFFELFDRVAGMQDKYDAAFWDGRIVRHTDTTKPILIGPMQLLLMRDMYGTNPNVD